MTAHLGALEAVEGLDAPCRRHPHELSLAEALAPDSGARYAGVAALALTQ